uniref:Uncharacterized protein n=1 Tax=Knipowitschia caucasica TaxID=637954 RepID=A0AAV2KAG7_KNICA
MDKTFSYRRYEVVRDAPLVQDFKERWPGLFDVYEINAEFKRLTTIPLQSRFLSQLDIFSNKLLALFKKRGGQIGKKLQELMKSMTDEYSDEAVDAGRECILKALCVYLNEDPDILIKEHVAALVRSAGAVFELSVREYKRLCRERLSFGPGERSITNHSIDPRPRHLEPGQGS